MLDVQANNKRFPAPDYPRDSMQDIEAFHYAFFRKPWGVSIIDEDGQTIASPPSHREFYHVWTHPREYPSVIDVEPRGYSKTTKAIIGLLHNICHNGPSEFRDYLYISSSQTRAEEKLGILKNELTSNELLIKQYGKLSSEDSKNLRWSSDVIQTKNRIQVTAIGRGSSARGMHPDWVIVDDLEREEEGGQLSPEEVVKTGNWLRHVIFGMLIKKRSRIFWLGNFIGFDSLLYKAYWGKEDWDEDWYRMMTVARDENGRSTWPAKFTDEMLAQKELKMTPVIFQCEMQNDPPASLSPLFERSHFRYFEEVDLPPNMFKIMSVDPAISQKRTSDYRAINVMGADAKAIFEKYFNLYATKGRWGLDDFTNIFLRTWRVYRPDIVRVENNAMQDVLVQHFEQEIRRQNLPIDIERVRMGKGGIAKDKFKLLDSVSPHIRQGQVYFRKEQAELIDNLIAFPNVRHDDDIDAFATCLDGFKTHWATIDRNYRERHMSEYANHDPGPVFSELGM